MKTSGNRRMIVVIGGANLDIQGRSREEFRPGDSNPGSITVFPGGVGRNIAENLFLLGYEVELITVFGTDDESRWLRERCGSAGLGLSASLVVEGSCPRYLCLLDASGRVVGAVADMALCDSLTPEHLERHGNLLDSAAAIVVDANIPEACVAFIAQRYAADSGSNPTSEARPLLVLDPVSAAKARHVVAYVGAFDLVKPNLEEARILGGSGLEEQSRSGLFSSLAHSLHGKGVASVFISLGAKGLFYCDGSHSGLASLPGSRADVVGGPDAVDGQQLGTIVNVSGAGDAACAALVLSTLEGVDAPRAASRALAAAALTAGAEAPVNPELSRSSIDTLSQGVLHESLARCL